MARDSVTWKIGNAPYPRVQGAHGARYRVGPLCAVPTCGRMADHAHHLWSRSYLPARGGGGWDWVLVEGVVVANLLPLCWRHHEDCTGSIGGYHAGIRYEPESGCLFWVDDQGEQELVWGAARHPEPYVSGDVELCTECGRRKPTRKRPDGLPVEGRRPKTRLVFTVPKDEREDGEAIVRDQLSKCAELIGRSEGESYYTLVDVLSWFAWNYHPDAEEFTGEGPCPTCGSEVVL